MYIFLFDAVALIEGYMIYLKMYKLVLVGEHGLKNKKKKEKEKKLWIINIK